MSNYDFLTPRQRQKHLFIVEGQHEKDKLFRFMFNCFPEIDIRIDDVIIYGTNIYHLHQDIINEHGQNWTNEDVDLPYIVSTKIGSGETYHKRDFSNILLIFDYERHDPLFSANIIADMQRYFCDVAGNGQLYLNYPMVEAYQDLHTLPDIGYQNRMVAVSLQPGHKYKNQVKKTSAITNIVDFPDYLDTQLEKSFGVHDAELRANLVNNLLLIHSTNNLLQEITRRLTVAPTIQMSPSAPYYFAKLVMNMNYASLGKTFYEYARDIMCQIIFHNIRKASYIQTGNYSFPDNQIRPCFNQLDMNAILNVQNSSSANAATGSIWVLGTAVLFVPEYNFGLLNTPPI